MFQFVLQLKVLWMFCEEKIFKVWQGLEWIVWERQTDLNLVVIRGDEFPDVVVMFVIPRLSQSHVCLIKVPVPLSLSLPAWRSRQIIWLFIMNRHVSQGNYINYLTERRFCACNNIASLQGQIRKFYIMFSFISICVQDNKTTKDETFRVGCWSQNQRLLLLKK